MKWNFTTSYHWNEENIGSAEGPHTPSILVAPPPVFKGPDGHWSPEDLLLSAVETCLFLSFLFLLKRSSLELLSYSSRTTGVLEKLKDGLTFTSITITPTVRVNGSREEAERLLEEAHASCLVSRSLSTPVTVEPTFL